MSYVAHDRCNCRVPRPDTHGLNYCTNIDCYRRIVKVCGYCQEEIKEGGKFYSGINLCEGCWKENATMVCSVCTANVPMVSIDPDTKKRYCDTCWKFVKKPAAPTYPRNNDVYKTCTSCGKSVYYGESHNGLFKCMLCVREEKHNVVGITTYYPNNGGSKLEKCISCKSLCSLDGGDFIQGEFICNGCMQDDKGGEIHVKVKVRGNAKMTAFWHWVITQCDSDWPFLKQEKDRQECPKCGGLIYKNPLLEVQEIKTLAEECKVGKVKIKFWGTKEECEGGKIHAA